MIDQSDAVPPVAVQAKDAAVARYGKVIITRESHFYVADE